MGAFLCLTAGVLTACSDDAADSPLNSREVHLSAGSRQFVSDADSLAEAPAVTRAVTWPDGTNSLYPTDESNMLIFIAKPIDNPTSSDVTSRLFAFTNTNNDWQANVTITDPSLEYQIFGFMPIDIERSSDNVSISPLPSSTNYTVGARLTISGLKVLTDCDPCVIVGVARQETATSNVTMKWGKFGFNFTDGSGDITDYMSILLDHIYSRFHFQMKVDASYAALRTIRITEMTLEALNNTGNNTLRSVTATVDIRSNTTNSNPVSSISYSRNAGERIFTLYNKKTTTGLALNATSFKEIGYCLAPYDQQWFRLTTKYDVMDRNGSLIRSNEAINKFNTTQLKTQYFQGTKPGVEHTIYITVTPTYLYQLSDPDLDNPTVVVN